jgi:hypothetical protein
MIVIFSQGKGYNIYFWDRNRNIKFCIEVLQTLNKNHKVHKKKLICLNGPGPVDPKNRNLLLHIKDPLVRNYIFRMIKVPSAPRKRDIKATKRDEGAQYVLCTPSLISDRFNNPN